MDEFDSIIDFNFNQVDMNNVRHSVERYNREQRKKNRIQYFEEDEFEQSLGDMDNWLEGNL